VKEGGSVCVYRRAMSVVGDLYLKNVDLILSILHARRTSQCDG
jgi:hypothetical protein